MQKQQQDETNNLDHNNSNSQISKSIFLNLLRKRRKFLHKTLILNNIINLLLKNSN